MSEDKPLISIIMPTYNRAHLLMRAIKSILKQTFKDFELLIIDDASTDNTEEIVYSFHNPKIIYMKSYKTMGAAAARNKGLKEARGKYIGFQDSDDEWMPDKLHKQLNILQHSSAEVGAVYCAYKRIDVGKNECTYLPNCGIREGNIHKDLLDHNFIDLPTTLIKRSCFDRVGFFDPDLPRLQDWELWLRLSKLYDFKFINQVLVNIYVTSDSITANEQAGLVAYKKILTKYYKDFLLDGGYKGANLFYKVGRWILERESNMEEARLFYLRAIKIYPYKLKFIAVYILALFGKRIHDTVILYFDNFFHTKLGNKLCEMRVNRWQ